MIIKNVEGTNITLDEKRNTRMSFNIGYCIVGFCLLMVAGFIFGSICSFFIPIYYNSHFINALSLELMPLLIVYSVIVAVFFSIILLSVGVFHKYGPAYRISISGVREIIIERVTPEVDQIAICNALQEMEIIAKRLCKERRDLERIVAKCK